MPNKHIDFDSKTMTIVFEDEHGAFWNDDDCKAQYSKAYSGEVDFEYPLRYFHEGYEWEIEGDTLRVTEMGWEFVSDLASDLASDLEED